MTDQLNIQAEMTPNPNTLKFNINRTLIESGSYDFPSKESAKDSYLASQLFQVDRVEGVFVGKDFITVTKSFDAEWQSLAAPLIEKIKTILNSGENLISEKAKEWAAVSSGNTETEQKIRAILDNEIRPAVARDGGDIIFYGYKNGIVTLHLQGSCSSCPSSIMTLKMGVENRLKHSIPEITEVVQI